ncbi:MAG: DUF5011 domain-containing protein [Ruminococcaceae bacterium]|nr:DUF5011 domain-containing protein [Oscillospiraceae bacterium]
MRKDRKNSNTVTVIALVLFAVALLALVPVVGDWVLEEFIYADPTTPGSSQASVPSAPSAPSSVPSVPPVVDTAAPLISGTKDLEVYAGDAVSYKSGVTVTDDLDPKPTLSIDNSQVDLSKPGVYSVTYTATDASGNKSSVTVKLTVKVKPENYVDPEVIYAKADAILAQFIRPDMTDREKAEAVYVWTRRSVHLTYGSAPKGFDHESADWLQCAYQLINKDVIKGDCFFFFAAQKLLLQRLGLPTIDCEKIYDGNTHHYWLLVSVDGGKSYYHFDNVWSKSLCLVTDAELDAFSAAIDSHPFNRNPNLYPATPTEPLPAGELPWTDPAILAAKP